MERILRIHERLGNGHRLTVVSIAAEFETSPRTIKRDIELMRDRLGAPIAWDAAKHSYCYTRACDLLPLLRLDADEALALVLASRTFAAWRGSALGRALTGASEGDTVEYETPNGKTMKVRLIHAERFAG